MKLYRKPAFSLTELLIVLVIIAVLFAAAAPILTKRRSGASFSNESVWNYVSNDDMMDAFYNPGVPGWTSSAYIGTNPVNVPNTERGRAGKIVIRAANAPVPQRQIQFRYGTGDGVFAGTLHVDNKSNLLLGPTFSSMLASSSYTSNYNTAAGVGVFSNLGYASKVTAYGAYALGSASSLAQDNNVIAVGSNVGRKLHPSAKKNIFIGAGSGASKQALHDNIALGAYSLGSDNSVGSYNFFAGSQTGAGLASTSATHNVVIGSKYYLKEAARNTIIGYDTYSNGHSDITNMTAIGYGACASFVVPGKTGTRSCIGYNSGGRLGQTPDAFNGDNYDRVFLGGAPEGGFSGRSVLEVHDVGESYEPLASDSASGRPNVKKVGSNSVVLNSNLAVRGNLYTLDATHKMSGFRFIDITQNLHGDDIPNFCENDRWKRIRRRYGCVIGGRQFKPDPPSRNVLDSGSGENRCNSDTTSYKYDTSHGCPDLKISSDLRLKTNLSLSNVGLEQLLNIKPYVYTFKDDKDKTLQVGVVAQDLQKIFPNSVSVGTDGYLRIRWDEMFYAAINAIKTLSMKLDKIASDVDNIEASVHNITLKHKDLHKRISLLNSRVKKLESK